MVSLRNSFNAFVRLGLLFSFLISLILVSTPCWVFGQANPLPPLRGIEPSQRSGDIPEVQEKATPPKPTPPSQEIVPDPKLRPLEEGRTPPEFRVPITTIDIQGNTVLSEEELAQVKQEYIGRSFGTSDLQEFRQRLSQLYADKGYINSGAVIPDQTVEDGTIIIQVIEGEMTDIAVEGTTHFHEFYLKNRLGLGTGFPFRFDKPFYTENRNDPFNIETLRERLQLLLQDPRIQRLNAEIIPGLQRGADTLKVDIEETSPYNAWFEFNNFQNPSVGAERGLATVEHLNPLGLGDRLGFTYGRSEGTDPLVEFNYEVPFTKWDTTLQLRYRKTNFKVVDGPFEDLDIKLKTNIYGVTIRQPLYRTVEQEFAFSAQFEYLDNKNSLLGRGFPFFNGATPDGKQKISALRFIQEYIHRNPGQVLSLRSRFSVGIDALGATVEPGASATGQFFVWLGQAQLGKQVPMKNVFEWLGASDLARRYANYSIQVLSRMDFQFANDDLFPLEEYAMGGRFSVRGYRENTLVRDNAFLFSFETRIPVWRNALGQNYLQVAPFVDVGRSWNVERVDVVTETLASIGVGLLASLPALPGSTLQVYYGARLNHVPNPHDNLQDDGIHVQFTFQALPLPGFLEDFFYPTTDSEQNPG